LAIWAATAGNRGRALVLRRRVWWAAAAIAATCLIAFLAFLAGEHQQRPVTVLRGMATVGYQEASVITAGWVYGIQGTDVPWIDQDGMWHYGSWPTCLGGPGRAVEITFGEVPVSMPDGGTARQVVWVDCRS
jgi:hypothetical protein